jgi:hypothetical protein
MPQGQPIPFLLADDQQRSFEQLKPPLPWKACAPPGRAISSRLPGRHVPLRTYQK